MGVVQPGDLEPMAEDPDDYRPNSRWRLVVDPEGSPGGRLADLAVIYEEIAPGDHIPLHRHPVDEVILVVAGEGRTRLDDEITPVGAGSTIFIPAGTPHGTACSSSTPLQIRAVYPTTLIGMEMLARNPAPGTESRSPGKTVYDMRTGAFWDADAPAGA